VHLVQASLAGKIEYKDLVVGGVWLVRCRVWPPAGMAHSGGGAIASRAVTYLGTESPPDCAEVAVGVDTMGNVVVRCKELLAVARGCRSVESLSSSSISRALLAFKAVDENGLMFDATWSGTGVAKDQHTCKLMHAMTTVDQLAMRQGNAPAPGHAARLAALKQALNARASVEIEKALARIACTASSCSRANPITVVAEQLGAAMAVGVQDVWEHGVRVTQVHATHKKASTDDLTIWKRKYSTGASDIALEYLADELHVELIQLKDQWPLVAVGADLNIIAAPTLTEELAVGTTLAGKTLLQITDPQLKMTKPGLFSSELNPHSTLPPSWVQASSLFLIPSAKTRSHLQLERFIEARFLCSAKPQSLFRIFTLALFSIN
jgi:hypothetical protein